MSTETANKELRMPANEFDRIMRLALQSPPPPKEKKKPGAKNATAKRRK